jgi:2-(1,2-epoxy-1,2-dihydrophenyl)acetyl-CoA isomerase
MSASRSAPAGRVRVERDGDAAVIVLDRAGARNALDVPLARGFAAAVESVAADGSVRAVLLRAEGDHFGVGGDLAAMRDGDPTAVAAALIDLFHPAVLRLQAMDAPVVAAVQGAVAGGSLSLALACDLCLAADDARFDLAYGGIGASSDVGSSWHLPRLVGLRRALQLALLPGPVPAAEALAMGLVNRVVPRASLADASRALVARLAAGPTRAQGRLKRLLRDASGRSLAAQLDAEREAFLASTRTDDFREGLHAFFARRPARFEGR